MEFNKKSPISNKYNSPISIDDAARGIKAAVLNGKDLLNDAQLLFDNERYARAMSLAILAIEEIGKVEIIKNLLLSKQKVASIWKDVRDHKSKNIIWQFPILKHIGLTDARSLENLIDRKAAPAAYLDDLKQLGFYTEALENENSKSCNWVIPSEAVDKESASFYIQTARQIVLDDRIEWTPLALKTFMEHNEYNDKNAVCRNPVLYYRTLCQRGCINEDRLQKIIQNINMLTVVAS